MSCLYSRKNKLQESVIHKTTAGRNAQVFDRLDDPASLPGTYHKEHEPDN